VKFESLQEEVQFLRAVVRVMRVSDEIIEDCLENQLGVAAAIDVFLAQAIRMVPANAGFVQVRGTRGPVITRVAGRLPVDVDMAADMEGPLPVPGGHLYVRRLDLGSMRIGALGILLAGILDDERVMSLIDTMAEMLDTALLSFLALAEGRSPLERFDELNDATHFMPKARIGRYELVCPLGAGGMAQVMVARTLGPEGVSRLVALKRILPHLCGDPAMVEQFLDEARLGLRLSHPNLVTVYDFGQTAAGYYIAMELVRGVDLHDFIYSPAGPLAPPVASAVLCQALAGLHAAHETRAENGTPLDLVHRDLSPANVMVGFDGTVKVMDFGVAKVRAQRNITQPGTVKGKPLYMAPEQAVADPIDRRADLFAMGLILYEALTGDRAFERANDTATMEAIVSDPLSRHPAISDAMWSVVERALEKNPELRYQTAEQMRQAVEAAVPPLRLEEIGHRVSVHFPDRRRKVSQWEQPPVRRDVAERTRNQRTPVKASGNE
jgi:serine/threonine-protein kinase